MKSLFTKLKVIYLPLLLLGLVFLLGYTFTHWLLLIKLNLFSMSQEIINFGLPVLLSCSLVFFYIRPRLKQFEFVRSHSRFFYQLIAVISIAVPTIIAQSYIETATGELTQLQSIHELPQQPQTKYYQLNQFYIDKNKLGVFAKFETTGKHNTDFNMRLYFALPIFKDRSESFRNKATAWYGKIYHKKISNRLNHDEKTAEYEAFVLESLNDLSQLELDKFEFLDRIGLSTDLTQLQFAAQKSDKYQESIPQTQQIILMPRFTTYEARNNKTISGITLVWLFNAMLWLVMTLLLKWKHTIEQGYISMEKVDYSSSKRELKYCFDFLRPKVGFIITPTLLYLNIFIFIAIAWASQSFFSFPSSFLLEWGANFRTKVVEGEWWRLLSSVFIHGGIAHLVFNLFALYFAGMFLEPLLGKWRLLLIYLSLGALASIASISWYEATISIGASGAIMGLLGLCSVWYWKGLFAEELNLWISISLTGFITSSFVIGLFDGVDNAAHIGGLCCGLLLGLWLRPIEARG